MCSFVVRISYRFQTCLVFSGRVIKARAIESYFNNLYGIVYYTATHCLPPYLFPTACHCFYIRCLPCREKMGLKYKASPFFLQHPVISLSFHLFTARSCCTKVLFSQHALPDVSHTKKCKGKGFLVALVHMTSSLMPPKCPFLIKRISSPFPHPKLLRRLRHPPVPMSRILHPSSLVFSQPQHLSHVRLSCVKPRIAKLSSTHIILSV